MNLFLTSPTSHRYKSLSQSTRVLTEDWAEKNLYCPACESNNVDRMPNNKEAIDFVCPSCDEPYQLKACSRPIRHKIMDAGYEAMKRALAQDRCPRLVVMHYGMDSLQIFDLLLVPKHFLSLSAIEPRKPLAATARRAGWVGCNILLNHVPPNGRISLISAGTTISKITVRDQFQKTRPLSAIAPIKRGWTLDVLNALYSLKKSDFDLIEAYSLETNLVTLHPSNQHIRPKIRQQLQILRDLGYLKFIGRGKYRLETS